VVTKEPVKPAVTPKPAPEVKEPAPSVAPTPDTKLSAEIKALLAKPDQKVQSFSYLYADPSTEGRYLSTFNVKGSKIRIDLFGVDPYIIDNYFDTVYLDASTKSATARCESDKRCMSHNVDNTAKVFDASFSDYYVKTPYEWIKEVTYAELVGPEIVESRSATKIVIPGDGKTTYMWLSDTYGLPMRIVIEYDSGKKEQYGFKDYDINSIRSDAEVMPKFT